MKNMTEIINKYTAGEAGLEETNAALRAAGSSLYLNPGKNALSAGEIAAAVAGETAAEAGGFGLLDTGTGSLDKVRVERGKLVNCDVGEMHALCLIGGKVYRVRGDALAD